MKKYLLWLVTLLTLANGAAHAQDITGTWQGTVKPEGGKDVRLVLKVAKADAGALKGTLYSIDQTPQPIPVSTLSVQAGTVKYDIPGVASYEGKLSADGSTITGTWTQGASTTTLVYKHVTEAAAWPLPEPPAKLAPMAATADPSFEVATIKPSKPDQPGKAFTMRGRQIITINTTVTDLITFAYDVQGKQVSGGTPWMATDKFDITAVPDLPGQPSSAQLKSILRKLLTDRFKLTLHHDKKELSVYVLTVLKTGPKITKSVTDTGLPGFAFRGLGDLVVRNSTIDGFTHLMQSIVLDRPVVDQTGLTAKYDFSLKWTPDDSQFAGMGAKVPPPSDKADAGPSLFTAVQEQMGMKFEATKAPADVLVIDHVEKPSEN